MINSFKRTLASNLKNIVGWTTNRRILVFSVDDYGNIRLTSLDAKKKLEAKGVNFKSRFDKLDALDTLQDYEELFEVLQSVKDKKSNPAIFTTNALSANVDYKQSLEIGETVDENLDDTYQRLSQEDPRNFEGTFSILKKGISKDLIRPQFYGREHLNVIAFDCLLKDKNAALMANLELQSLAVIPNHHDLPLVRFSEAFSFLDINDILEYGNIIKDGLGQFEKVYGYKSTTFTLSSMLFHPKLYSLLEASGIQAIDKPRVHKLHLGYGSYQKAKNKLGIQKIQDQINIVRNCMFEPISKNIDWVNFTFEQIKTAFFWGKPAVISSNRINFCGLIDFEKS